MSKNYKNIYEWYKGPFLDEMEALHPDVIQPDLDDLSEEGFDDVIDTFNYWMNGLWGTFEEES